MCAPPPVISLSLSLIHIWMGLSMFTHWPSVFVEAQCLERARVEHMQHVGCSVLWCVKINGSKKARALTRRYINLHGKSCVHTWRHLSVTWRAPYTLTHSFCWRLASNSWPTLKWCTAHTHAAWYGSGERARDGYRVSFRRTWYDALHKCLAAHAVPIKNACLHVHTISGAAICAATSAAEGKKYATRSSLELTYTPERWTFARRWLMCASTRAESEFFVFNFQRKCSCLRVEREFWSYKPPFMPRAERTI